MCVCVCVRECVCYIVIEITLLALIQMSDTFIAKLIGADKEWPPFPDGVFGCIVLNEHV